MERDYFELIKDEIGKVLNDVQKKAVLHTDGPLLLLASPGSGKTTTLNIKIGYLILEKKIAPNRILALTFSQASAQDMEERFSSFFANLIPEKVAFSTIHSFAFKIVREHFNKNNVKYEVIEGNSTKEKDSGLNFETSINKKMLIRRIYQSINKSNITEEEMEELISAISYVKNRLMKRSDLIKVKTKVKGFPKIFEAYEDFKRKDPNVKLLDFDDMLAYANVILKKDPEILAKYQNQFEYILTDESQDTSLVQHEIIEQLALPKNNICVVADDDQCLYGFRGCDVKKILEFKATYPNATILFMEQNYRSSQQIVNTANKFIQRNESRYKKNMFTENESKEDIVIKNFDIYEAQIDYVIKEVAKIENKKEIAILYRNNSSSIDIINALDLAGIPFYVKDTDNKFFSHWILKDIINFLKFAKDDTNVENLELVHTKFNGYITKRQVSQLKLCNQDKSVFTNLIEVADLKDWQVKNVRSIKSTFAEIKNSTPKQAIKMIRKELGYDKVLEKISESLNFSLENLLNSLNTLENIASKLVSIDDFEKRIEYLRELLRNSKNNKEALTLSTFHSSKGLEFDNVFMIDLVNGVIPSGEVIKDYKDGKKEDMEESVRLFYVGMTRARTRLELLSYKRKGKERLQESIFVTDVKKILNIGKVKDKKEFKPFRGKKATTLNLVVDNVVSHKKFGTGTIVQIEDDSLFIHFESGLQKQLSLAVCSENNILKVLS